MKGKVGRRVGVGIVQVGLRPEIPVGTSNPDRRKGHRGQKRSTSEAIRNGSQGSWDL